MNRAEVGGRPYDVFVSYSTTDLERATEVVEGLKELGYSVFFNAEARLPGGHHYEWLDEALDEAYAFVVLVSAGALESDNVTEEVIAARSRHRRGQMPGLMAILVDDDDQQRSDVRQAVETRLSYQKVQIHGTAAECLEHLQRAFPPDRGPRANGRDAAVGSFAALRSARGDTVFTVKDRRLDVHGPLTGLLDRPPIEDLCGVFITARGDGVVVWNGEEVGYAALDRGNSIRWDTLSSAGVRGVASTCDPYLDPVLLRESSPLALVREGIGGLSLARPPRDLLPEGVTSAVHVQGAVLWVDASGRVGATGHLEPLADRWRDVDVVRVDASCRGAGKATDGVLLAVLARAGQLGAEVVPLDGRRFDREPRPSKAPLPRDTADVSAPRPYSGLAGFQLLPLLARSVDGTVFRVGTESPPT